jgi:hypothetical protein
MQSFERGSQLITPSYEALWVKNNNKNEVLDKVTQIPREMLPENFNYQGYRSKSVVI